MREALEKVGLIFVAENAEGPGVRLRKTIKGEVRNGKIRRQRTPKA
jgi:hypothetical protein